MRRFTGISATLFACIAGCGDDASHQRHDAAVVVDANGDAAAPDATPMGDVTVTTLARCCQVSPGTPVAAVPVVVIQPDGTPGTGGMTDATGKLTLHGVKEGAAITVIYPEDVDNNDQITTTLGVKPGDNLTYGDHYYGDTATGSAGTMTINMPAIDGAIGYVAVSPCGYNQGGSNSLSQTLSTYCQTATAAIALYAYDNSGAVVASGYLPAAPFTPDSTATLASWTVNDSEDVTVTATGLGAEVTSVGVAGEAFYPNDDYDDSNSATISGGSASATITLPLAYPRMVGNIELSRDSEFGDIDSYHPATVAASTASVSIAQPAMPWLGTLAASAGVGKALWLQTAGTYAGAVFSANWSHYDSVNEINHNFNWDVIVPPGQTELDFGTPPAALAAVLPTSTDDISADVELVNLASATTYDAFRGTAEWQLESPQSAVEYGDQAFADVSTTPGDGGEGVVGVPSDSVRAKHHRLAGHRHAAKHVQHGHTVTVTTRATR